MSKQNLTPEDTNTGMPSVSADARVSMGSASPVTLDEHEVNSAGTETPAIEMTLVKDADTTTGDPVAGIEGIARQETTEANSAEQTSTGNQILPAEQAAVAADSQDHGASRGTAAAEESKSAVAIAHSDEVESNASGGDANMFPSPVVAGEDPVKFRKIVDELTAEYKPQNLQERFLVDETAQAHWLLQRLGQGGRWLTNAAIARSLHRQVVNKTAVEQIEQNRAAGKGDPLQSEENMEGNFRQAWWRHWENTAFAAVSGNVAAIERVEGQLGRNAVSLNAFVNFDELSTSLILLERAAMPARGVRDAGFRLLNKIEKKRRKQTAVEKIDAERKATGSSAGADVLMPDPAPDPVTDDQRSSDPTVSVHVPKNCAGETDGETQ